MGLTLFLHGEQAACGLQGEPSPWPWGEQLCVDGALLQGAPKSLPWFQLSENNPITGLHPTHPSAPSAQDLLI